MSPAKCGILLHIPESFPSHGTGNGDGYSLGNNHYSENLLNYPEQ